MCSSTIRSYYLANPLEIVQTWKGGMAFHGGLIGAILGMWLFARREKLTLLTASDLCATVAPIGIFFGRLANFIKPEMWGRETDLPWAMAFPRAGDAPRHPSQLYEAGLEGLALLVVLAAAARAGALKRPGLATGVFGVGYGLARIFCEFFREPRPGSGGAAPTGSPWAWPCRRRWFSLARRWSPSPCAREG